MDGKNKAESEHARQDVRQVVRQHMPTAVQPPATSSKAEVVNQTENTNTRDRQSHQHPVHGTRLIEKDFAMLERSGIRRERAEQLQWRRVDSFTGADMVGRNGSSGDYSGILIAGFWPGSNKPYSYSLRRDHPDLELKGDGTEKEKAKYVAAPTDRNKLYFAYGTLPEWLEDTSLTIVATEGEKKCESLFSLAWQGLGDAADKPRWQSNYVNAVRMCCLPTFLLTLA